MKKLFTIGLVAGVLYLLRNVFKVLGWAAVFALLYFLSTIIL